MPDPGPPPDPGPDPGRDPGLQPERTALAWTRTAASLVLLPVPLVVIAARRQEWALLVACGIALALSATTAIRLTTEVRRAVHHEGGLATPYSDRLLPVLALLLLVSGCAVAAAVTS